MSHLAWMDKIFDYGSNIIDIITNNANETDNIICHVIHKVEEHIILSVIILIGLVS